MAIDYLNCRNAAVWLSLTFMASCGGGGGGTTSPPPPPPPPPTGTAPSADAGADQNVAAGDVVMLNGSATDPDGGSISYTWAETSGPDEILDGSSSQNAQFRASYIDGSVNLGFQLTATDSGGLTGVDDVVVIVNSKFTSCSPTAPPPSLGLDSFYEKYCDAGGIPVVSSNLVPDRALEWVRYQAMIMSGLRPDVTQAMIDRQTRIAIMADSEVTTDIPEHSDLYVAFPGTDWDTRARGLGATVIRPASSAAEENVLCYSADVYRDESIFIHEFAHTMDVMGLQFADPTFSSRLQMAYDAAMSAGLWANTYAATNKEEYWAEGAQDWFNSNLESDPPNGIHNSVNTRQELGSYDQNLYQLLLEVMPETDIPACPQ